MHDRRINNPHHASTAACRKKPLALALVLALAGGASFAGPAMAAPTAATGAPLPDQAATATSVHDMRPDGSILRFVTNCNDAGTGSLRAVAAQALHGDGIDLTTLTCSQISVTTGTITLRDVELIGPGADRLTINGLGNQNRRVFNHVSQGGDLHISGVTVSGGKYLSNAGQGGGCLRSNGGFVSIRDAVFTNCAVITPVGGDGSARGGAIAAYGDDGIDLTNVTISDSFARTDHAFATGGGVFARGNVDMRRSTITNNSVSASGSGASTVGGGLYTLASAWIDRSTIDGNVSEDGRGGGVMVGRGGYLRESTVSNNHAVGGASGIAFLGADEGMGGVYSSTISGNSIVLSESERSGALYMNTAVSMIVNSTITDNSETNLVSTKFGAGVVFGPNVTNATMQGTIASGSYFDDGVPPYAASDIDGPPSLVISGNANLVGWSHRPVPPDTNFDPVIRLGPLQDNGGPTWTHLPLAGSPAIDRSDQAGYGFNVDQRGYPRVVGATADIGSVEVDDVIFADGFQSCPPARGSVCLQGTSE